ncbi:fasciclin domain-containing protein [Dyadobacter sp. CY347]|uniref:fasciclin domain-containing protein n=1 Tax=Dyadobacter sp. CY347 TaxID=2909336 RepID=UPI001F37854A|nr:fasciclin domain-containing protein [Dyadobacter sp. CY347]MCF2489086.1 fasciclin domain-containing protein [Dyadobacter sp. CY347]
MRTFRTLTKSLFAAMVVFSFTACDNDDDNNNPVTPTGNIAAVASADPQFSTLVAALTKAELVTTLQGAGPFTVFAPNNAAFTKAGITSLDGLTKDALTPILTSHVLSGNVKAADVKSGAVETVNTNNDIYLSKNADGVFINGNIKVIATDVNASNGVVHVIDNVITPPTQSLVEVAQGNTDFSELVSLVLAADPAVATALSTASANGLTVFAPTNAAFTELYKTTPKATLLAPANRALLTSVLLYHVVPGRVFSTDLPNVSGEVATANPSGKVTFDLAGGAKVVGTTSGASNITAANILATNGVVHVIDKVLMP